MAAPVVNAASVAPVSTSGLADLDASRLKITLTRDLKILPPSDDLVFGKHTTDHMAIMEFHPSTGWSDPEIKPYAPLVLDPASSCFQYCPSVFEGMKAYYGVDRKPRLFRPELNMERMERSAQRVALPPFSGSALLKIIKRLVLIDARWIPSQPGCSLYIRPTIIGTRPSLGVAASDHALLYVIMSPTGPFFRVPRAIALFAEHEHTRAWRGGTGAYKLGLNYAPGFLPQRLAAERGYDQVLWLLDEGAPGSEGKAETCKVTEAGAMNFFVVLKRDDGNLDVITPPLDGTILPGLTRASCLALTAAHPERTSLAGLPNTLRLHTHERTMTMGDLYAWHASHRLLEVFAVGTAAVVVAVGSIGFHGREDIVVPAKGTDGMGLGPVGTALRERIIDIQEGKIAWEGWSVLCE